MGTREILQQEITNNSNSMNATSWPVQTAQCVDICAWVRACRSWQLMATEIAAVHGT
jgi:hypothetical protein